MMQTMNPVSHTERWGFVFELIPIRYHNSDFISYIGKLSEWMILYSINKP